MFLNVYIFLAVLLLACADGANDAFNGAATLFGSGTVNYRTALWFAVVTTFAGSAASLFLAQTLADGFTTVGIVPGGSAGSPDFVLAVTAGAGLTVLAATIAGFPVSTTHLLAGAVIGAGYAGAAAPGASSAPGVLSALLFFACPLIAIVFSSFLYILLRFARMKTGAVKSFCFKVAGTEFYEPVPPPVGAVTLKTVLAPDISLDKVANRKQRYTGKVLGVPAQKILDFLHFCSAGTTGFVRGLNSTLILAAFLAVIPALKSETCMLTAASAMALGGLLGARRVAVTLSRRITPLTTGQGVAANFATSLLAAGSSLLGCPLSTTYLSAGSLFGVGLTTRQADRRAIVKILLSWFLALPTAALLSAGAYRLISALAHYFSESAVV